MSDTDSPDPSLSSPPPPPRFCNACGQPWHPTWATCPACEARRTSAATTASSTPANPVTSGLLLYFAFLAISVGGIIATTCGAPTVGTDLILTLVSSAVVAMWCLFSRREVIPPLARVPHVKWFAIAAVGSVATFLIASGALALLTRFAGVEQLRFTPEFTAAGYGPAIVALLIAVQPGVFEELAFRGVILGGLLHVLSPLEGVIVSAAMFMIIHLSVASFPHLFVMGLALGYLRVASGSLYPGMLLHFAHNLYCVAWEYWSPFPAW